MAKKRDLNPPDARDIAAKLNISLEAGAREAIRRRKEMEWHIDRLTRVAGQGITNWSKML